MKFILVLSVQTKIIEFIYDQCPLGGVFVFSYFQFQLFSIRSICDLFSFDHSNKIIVFSSDLPFFVTICISSTKRYYFPSQVSISFLSVLIFSFSLFKCYYKSPCLCEESYILSLRLSFSHYRVNRTGLIVTQDVTVLYVRKIHVCIVNYFSQYTTQYFVKSCLKFPKLSENC